MEDIKERCPECGSEEVSHRHVDADQSYMGECDWEQCDECGHQWNHG